MAEGRGAERRGWPGVSLGGVLLTLALVAGAAGLAIPAYFGRHGVTLDNAALLLAQELRMAQNRSAYLGVESVFAFEGDGWRVLDLAGKVVRRPGAGPLFERDLAADGVFEGVRVERVGFGEDAALVFDRYGRPQEAGEVVLGYRGEQRQVRVAPRTGIVSIEGLARPWIDDGH